MSIVVSRLLPVLIIVISCLNIPAYGEGNWSIYTDINEITSLTPDGEYVWATTTGGLVRWDTRDHSYRIWNIADGFPNNSLYSFYRRPDGTFWLCNYLNVYSFDPANELLTLQTTGLIGSPMSSSVDSNGDLWFITAQRDTLYRYNGNENKKYMLTDFDDHSSAFFHIASDQDGTIWIVTDRFVYCGRDDSWEKLDVITELHYSTDRVQLFFGEDNTPYAYTRFEIGIIDNGHYNHITDTYHQALAMIAKSPDDIWVTEYFLGLSHFDGQEWTRTVNTMRYTDESPNIILTGQGEVWISTQNGIYIYDKTIDDIKSHLYAETGPHNNTVHDFELDTHGNLWCLSSESISRWDGDAWHAGKSNLFMDWMSMLNIEITNDDYCWLSSYGGVTLLDNNTVTYIRDIPDWPQQGDSQGFTDMSAGDDLWMARSDSLFCYNGNEIRAWSAEEIQGSGAIRFVKVGDDGTVWIAGDDIEPPYSEDCISSISCWNGEGWQNWITPIAVFMSNIAIAPDGNIWIQGATSLYNFNPDTEQFTLYDSPVVYVPTPIACDTYGRPWIGIKSGVAMFDNGEWNYFGLHGHDPGYFDIHVNALQFDNDGNLWVGTESGVYRYTPDTVPVTVEDAQKPEALPTITAYPNPFNPSTSISFTLPESGQASLTVYNLAGQKVRTLAYEPMAAGKHTVVWDGRDDDGNAVAAGVYVTRLNVGGSVATGKMVLVK